MIDPAIRILDLDPREWTNLVRFLSTPAPLPGAESRRKGGLFVLHGGGHVLKAVQTGKGRVGDLPWEGTGALKALAKAQGVRWVVAVEEGGLDELMHRVQERVRIDQDSLSQGLEWAKAFRELLQEGRIAVHPRPLEGVPIPQASTMMRALDLALPDDRTAVAYLFDGPEVWTSIVIRKSRGAIDLVAGHRALGLHPAEVRSFLDYPRILDAVRRRFGEPHAGFFAERRVVERLFADPRPGMWARAYALKEVIVEPMTPWGGMLLGSGVVREAFDRSRKLLSKLDPLGLATPLARAAREKLSSSVDFKSVLGFDPFEVLERLIRLEDD